MTTNGFIHFMLTNGSFNCNGIVIKPFVNNNLRLLNCGTLNDNNNNYLDISNLSYKNIKIDYNGYHFTLCGDINIIYSVCLTLLFLFLFFCCLF
jgi:hypothetical protein